MAQLMDFKLFKPALPRRALAAKIPRSAETPRGDHIISILSASKMKYHRARDNLTDTRRLSTHPSFFVCPDLVKRVDDEPIVVSSSHASGEFPLVSSFFGRNDSK